MYIYQPTFLQVAAVKGPVELVKVLVKHKADVNFPVSSMIRYYSETMIEVYKDVSFVCMVLSVLFPRCNC